jgi:hypothetical protein
MFRRVEQPRRRPIIADLQGMRRFAMSAKYPSTPDGRYFVVRGRLWRLANPALPAEEKARLVSELMQARRAVRTAKLASDKDAEAKAHAAVDVAKKALGERGPVWWTDGAADLNRHMVKNTSYAAWFADLPKGGDA